MLIEGKMSIHVWHMIHLMEYNNIRATEVKNVWLPCLLNANCFSKHVGTCCDAGCGNSGKSFYMELSSNLVSKLS